MVFSWMFSVVIVSSLEKNVVFKKAIGEITAVSNNLTQIMDAGLFCVYIAVVLLTHAIATEEVLLAIAS